MLGTILKRLYKHIGKALNSDELDRAFILALNVVAPTMGEIAAIEAKVDDNALTKAIKSVKVLQD